MGCRAVVRDLPLLAGGDLAAERAATVREHLSRCFACARVFAGEIEARDALADVAWARGETPAIPGVDEQFFVQMQDEILAEVAASGPISTPERPWLRRRRFWFGGGFAAASVLFVVGFVLGGGLKRPGSSDSLRIPRALGRQEPVVPYEHSEPVSNGNGRPAGGDSQSAEPYYSSDRPLCGEDPDATIDEAGVRRPASRPSVAPPFVTPLRGEPIRDRR